MFSLYTHRRVSRPWPCTQCRLQRDTRSVASVTVVVEACHTKTGRRLVIVFFNLRYASTINVSISSSTSKTAMRQYLPRSVSLEILRNFVCKLLIPWSVFST